MTDRAYVMLHWEQDWSDPEVYFYITEDGMMIKYNILTEEVIEYSINRVVH